MNLFRSEEHLTGWLGGRDPGAAVGAGARDVAADIERGEDAERVPDAVSKKGLAPDEGSKRSRYGRERMSHP